jgi:GNAT superfamily N-acetyltransferase
MGSDHSGHRDVIEPMRARPRSAEQLAALFAGGWPAFIGADALAAEHLPRVRETFGDLEVVLLRDGHLVAAAWGVPIAWNGTPEDLPGGYSDALRRAVGDHQAGAQVDALVVCAAQVRPDATRRGLAATLITALADAGVQRGLHRVVAPLRPTLKHRYPLTAIQDYATWTRPDGLAVDPWLRTHHALGARTIAVTEASQVFTGTVSQWRAWTGTALPASGSYIVPEALAPLTVDHHADRGVLREPGIWVQHR